MFGQRSTVPLASPDLLRELRRELQIALPMDFTGVGLGVTEGGGDSFDAEPFASLRAHRVT